jgi:REP element-mobilizing transposase RayT
MDSPTRKDIRLDGYDYSRSGAYFVTVCTNKKQCLFWEHQNKYLPITEQPVGAASRRPQTHRKIRLSEQGKIVKDELNTIPSIYPNIIFIPKYVIMPNHVHMIIVIDDGCGIGGRRNAAPTISRIMNQFKGCVSRKCGFSVWQKSFYDRIIRNEHEYRAFWEYIETNPMTWENDELFSKE